MANWTDEELEHMCKLSVCTVELIRSPDNGITAPHIEPQNLQNMLSILADTFVQLQKRQNIKPKFSNRN